MPVLRIFFSWFFLLPEGTDPAVLCNRSHIWQQLAKQKGNEAIYPRRKKKEDSKLGPEICDQGFLSVAPHLPPHTHTGVPNSCTSIPTRRNSI